MSSPPTTRQIAARTGFSQATVSRALSNSPSVPDETRRKILEIAHEMGWKPDPYASAYSAHLRGTRPSTFHSNLAFLLSDPASRALAESSLQTRIHYESARVRAQKLGFGIEPIWIHESGLTARRLTKILRARNIPGLIFSRMAKPMADMDQFEWKSFACATLGSWQGSPALHRVLVNRFHGFSLCLAKAEQRGHRRIAVLLKEEYEDGIDNGAILAAYHCKWSRKIKIDIHVLSKTTLAKTRLRLEKENPDALLAEESPLLALESMGWNTDHKVALISSDAHRSGRCDGLDQRHELWGAAAVNLVVTQIMNGERGIPPYASEISIEGTWLEMPDAQSQDSPQPSAQRRAAEKMNPTTREIALACDCSVSTVSRALAGSTKISDETKEKVQSAAARLGWRANPFATAYMVQLRGAGSPAREARLAFLVSEPGVQHISKTYLHVQKHYEGVCRRARALGYEVDLVWLHALTADQLNQQLRERNVSGLIFSKLVDPPDLTNFPWADFSSAALGTSLLRPELYRVISHRFHGFNSLLEKAAELGYKKVAVVLSASYDRLVENASSSAAYYQRDKLRGICRIDVHIFHESGKAGSKEVEKWLRAHKPEIIVAEDFVRETIDRMKWRIPEDIAFISPDVGAGQMGGFNQRHDLHGALAVDLVVGQILRNERGIPKDPHHLLVEGCWSDGYSAPSRNTTER